MRSLFSFILLLSTSAFAATGPYCREITAARLVPRIQSVSVHPNSARGEEKKLLTTEIAARFHEDLTAVVSSWRARDEAPVGKRLGTMTYYPAPIKNDPQLIERFVATLPANQRNYYRQVLAEFSDRNRVRMREYVEADANIDPYKSTDVNRGFVQSNAMVFNDKNGTPTRFFNLEWKIKIGVHQKVDISLRNANIKPSLPVPNHVFKSFLNLELTDDAFADKCTQFYAFMRDQKRLKGKPLKDDWDNDLAHSFYLKMAAYFRAAKSVHGDRFITSRVTYSRTANEYSFEFDSQVITGLEPNRKNELRQALGKISDTALPADDKSLFKHMFSVLEFYAGGKLGVWKGDQLTTTMQMTRDPVVFFESVGSSLSKPNWRGVYDAEKIVGHVPKGSVFTESKISLPWLVLLEKSKKSPEIKKIIDIVAQPILKADALWEKLKIHQDPTFDANKGKIAFYQDAGKNFEGDVLGAGPLDDKR